MRLALTGYRGASMKVGGRLARRRRGVGRSFVIAAALILTSLLCAAPSAPAAPTQVTEYGVGSVGSPRELVVDGSGNLWFTEGGLGAIGKVTPQGQITSYDEGLEGVDPTGLIVGPGGDIWFGLQTKSKGTFIGRITAAGAITLYGGYYTRNSPQQLAVGPEGNVWFVSDSYIAPSIGYVTPLGGGGQLELPSAPSSIAAGPGANMWFTYGGEGNAAIGSIKLNEGGGATVALFRAGLPTDSEPESLVGGPDGNLWFTDFPAEAIGRVTSAGQIEEFPTGDWPEQIVPGAEGNLWIQNLYGLSRSTTAGAVTFVETQPLDGRRLRDIALGPEGDVWFAGEQDSDYLIDNGTVGRVSPSGAAVGYSDDLPAGSQPEEIVRGAGSEMWFADRGTAPAIGRVIPGEDPKPTPPSRPSPPTGGSPHPGPSGPSGPTGPGRLIVSARHLSVGRGGLMRMLVTCADGRSCAGRLSLTTVVHRPGAHGTPRQPIIAAGKFSVDGAGSAWLRVRLTRRGRGLLRTGGGRLRAIATFTGPFSRLDGPTVVSLLLRSGGSRPR
jgi:streptogramin lyase